MDWVVQKLTELFQWLLDSFRYFFREFLFDASDWVFGMIDTVLGSMGYEPSLQQWSTDLLNQVNYFIPLSEAFAVLTILLSVWCLLSGFKLLMKSIPFFFKG